MAPNRPGWITDREAEVLRILWEREDGRLEVIHSRFNELNEPEVSCSAVLRTLQRLERKDMVRRVRIGSSNVYSSSMPIGYARTLMMWHVVRNYFDDDILKLRSWVEGELELRRRMKARRDALVAERLAATRARRLSSD